MFRDRRKKFNERLKHSGIVVAPGAYDSLTAKLVEQAGFEALYLTGAGVSYSMLGTPDIGLITANEMADKAQYVCESVKIPVIADGDTGYGNALNVIRTVKSFERAGVAAIQLEDQEFPKKCGHLENKKVISADEMVGKIKAATDARTDEHFLIIARTDARATDGLKEAVERAYAYSEAGADIIFVEAPQSVEEMQEIAKIVQKPLVANMVEGGKTPVLPISQLETIGYKIAIFPNSVTRFVVQAAQELYRELKEQGSTVKLRERMLQFDQLNELLDLEAFRKAEMKYGESKNTYN